MRGLVYILRMRWLVYILRAGNLRVLVLARILRRAVARVLIQIRVRVPGEIGRSRVEVSLTPFPATFLAIFIRTCLLFLTFYRQDRDNA